MSLDLYQKEILALAKQGSTPERLDAPDASARVDNALCGDRVTIDVTVSDGKITGLGHKVQGCALCRDRRSVNGNGNRPPRRRCHDGERGIEPLYRRGR